ncbi:MAG: hypothetical protein ACKOQ4_09805 [Mycobacterium sp.]
MTMSRSAWITWLQVVLAALLAYALVLVFAGSVAGQLFSVLGFGPPESIDSAAARDYLKLPFMVLGAVLAGWAVTMIQIVRGPLRDGSPWAPTILIRSVAVWFVLDTGMSLVLGFPTHAVFNLIFVTALGIPLLALRAP